MENRSHILEAVRKNKPEEMALPSIKKIECEALKDPIGKFKELVQAIGGRVEEISYEDVESRVNSLFPEAKHIASGSNFYQGSIQLDDIKEPKALENLDVFVCKGELGVAENGAIWVPEHQMMHRVAPFIAQHLVILLKESAIVENMHDAYEEIDVAEEGFGVFIAGPSKTADIEQSLVLGAHGPRSLTVLLLKTP